MRFKTAFGLLVSASAATCLTAQIAWAEPITLTYSKWLPLNYYVDRDVIIPTLEKFETVTEGRVKVEITPKVVGTVTGQYDVVADGLADISFIVPGYTPGKFPLTEGLDLAFLGDDPSKRCPATWEAYEKYLEPAGTFKEVKVLSYWCSSVAHFPTTGKIIKTIDDFKGLKIRSSNRAVGEALEAVGAAAVNKPASELYELLSGGSLDGAVIPMDAIPSFKLETVLKAVNTVPGGINASTVLLPINKAKWDMISEQDQKAIMELTGAALAKLGGEVAKREDEQAAATLRAAGAQIVAMEGELLTQLKERYEPIRQKWVQLAKDNGLADPEAMLAILEEAAR